MNYIGEIFRVLSRSIYLLFFLLLWLGVRVGRRLRLAGREQRLLHEVRCQSLLLRAQAGERSAEATTFLNSLASSTNSRKPRLRNNP